MNPDHLFSRARLMAAQSPTPMTANEALAILGKRGAAKRNRKPYGVLHPIQADRRAFENVETPAYWWQDHDD